MRKIYSVILFVSLLVGTLQPILPMVEYQLHQGDIIELLGFGDDELEANCDMTICMIEDCETPEDQAEQSLLDLDYYPLALEITAIPSPHVFLSSTRFYLPITTRIISPTFLPNPPPPRLS